MSKRIKQTAWVIVLLWIQLPWLSAQVSQYVYRTPSGTRYHTAQCKMVDNTSNSILRSDALEKGMQPCTFCKPDTAQPSKTLESAGAVTKPGQKDEASQCLGTTQKGYRCERKTKNANGYCFQHLPPDKT